MAKCAEDSAKALNIPHITAKIPWATGVFPPKPSAGEPIELVARNARFRVLFDTMSQQDAPVIAYGHHADDQVETSLMRLAAGSGELGAGAMKRVRRWGMGVGKADMGLGGSDDINFFGYEGMRKWIIRPLLDVSKVRDLFERVQPLTYDRTGFWPLARQIILNMLQI
jgi:tRNA(Ile)-lysidine synthase TilS/MesJ